MKIFTKLQINFIKENYQIYGSKYCAEKLGFSITQIKNKAAKLKLITPTKTKINFTKEQINFTKENYPIYGNNYCAEKLKISIKEVRKIIKSFKLRKTNKPFSLNQIEFIKNNYALHGSKYCSDKTGLSTSKITKKANKLGIKVCKDTISKINKARKTLDSYRVDPTQFFKIEKKEIAYILGILWSDGHLCKKGFKISLEIINEDLKEIKNIFYATGKWLFYKRLRKGRKKEIGQMITTNRHIFEFLTNNFNYDKKSYSSANKIINFIKENLAKYWWRGYFDGDGCFYFNKKNKCKQMCITSSYLQNWDFAEILLKKLQIKYTIVRKKSATGNSSAIRVTNKKDIIKFGEYIYSEYDQIGFSRKYNKFVEIKNS